MSRGGYYAWRTRKPSRRTKINEVLQEEIERIFDESKRTYGSPRITVELKVQGIRCSENRVARIMAAHGIAAQQKRRFKRTTDSRHNYPVATNLLNQDFHVDKSNRVWVSDITYLSTPNGWQYLALFKDLHNRGIVGWALSGSLSSDLVIEALLKAIQRRKPSTDLIIHSDRGVQYASDCFRHLLQSYGIKQSMSRKGNCYDNAVAESMFATLKREIVNWGQFGTLEETKSLIFEYLEVFYNRKRRYSTLGNLTPEEFEHKFSNT